MISRSQRAGWAGPSWLPTLLLALLTWAAPVPAQEATQPATPAATGATAPVTGSTAPDEAADPDTDKRDNKAGSRKQRKAVKSGKAAKAVTRVDVRITGVTEEIQENILAYLTLSRFAQRDDLTDGQVRQLAYRAVDEAADAMRPFGYYAPRIRSRTTRDEPKWIVRLTVNPGDPILLNGVNVQLGGAGADDPALSKIIGESPVRVGAQLNHRDYEELKIKLLHAAQDKGYLDAKFTRRELVVDPKALVAQANLDFDTGGRYRFGSISIEQNVIDAQQIRKYLRFSEGENFDIDKLRGTQYALQDSNYFSSIAVNAGDRDPATLTVPITVSGEPIKRDRYAVSLGYGTDTGIRGKLGWDNRRANRKGHRLHADLIASEIRQEAVLRYLIPIGDPSLEKIEISSGYVNEDIGDLNSERFELITSLTQVTGEWQRVLFLKLNREITDYPKSPSRDDLLLIPGISFATMPPNLLTGWARNAAYFFELSGSPQSLGSDASFLRFYSRGERVWDIGGPWHLRLRGELGTSVVNKLSNLPASQRFFAGGDHSVRGFANNELSPVTKPPPGSSSAGLITGGEHLLTGSIELERDLPRDLRVAAFFDTGNAFNNWNTPLEYSIGVGLRLKLPMLMIGLDVAQALSEPGKKPRLHLNITQVL